MNPSACLAVPASACRRRTWRASWPRLASVVVLALALLGAGLPPALPDPRPASWVLDQAGLLDPASHAAIDAYAAALRRLGERELMVVTERSIGTADPRTHATAIYNHYGIGSAATSEGVLLWVAIDDRAAELILGDGLDTAEGRAIAEQIMQQELVPAFRAGRPAAALLAGSRAAAQRLLGLPAAEAPLADAGALPLPAAPQTGLQVPGWLAGSGIGAAALAALTALRRWRRHRPRRCAQCRTPMQRLGEAEDDAHLEPGERSEERLRSVDYDLWDCPSCPQVEKLRYGAWFTMYAKCPQCRARTRSSTSTTLVAATRSSGGQRRVDEHCEHCGYRHSSMHSTPRLSSFSSSSSGMRSGGRSSGGGASGRW